MIFLQVMTPLMSLHALPCRCGRGTAYLKMPIPSGGGANAMESFSLRAKQHRGLTFKTRKLLLRIGGKAMRNGFGATLGPPTCIQRKCILTQLGFKSAGRAVIRLFK